MTKSGISHVHNIIVDAHATANLCDQSPTDCLAGPGSPLRNCNVTNPTLQATSGEECLQL